MISIIIPTKNEPHLWDTIHDVEEHSITKPEILWFEDDGRGQRAICNHLADKAKGDIIVKIDAHCAFGPNFDQILLDHFEDDMVMAPLLYPLDAKTWTVSHHNPMGKFTFDENFVVNHAGKETGETMCMQGSFFMVTKKNYFDWELCDESLGSWGHQGCEIGIQTWLHGGRCVTINDTYYGHLFRHEDEEFPYTRDHKEIDKTHDLFVKKFSSKDIGWLIKKFNV